MSTLLVSRLIDNCPIGSSLIRIEPAHTATGQLPVPLPTAESAENNGMLNPRAMYESTTDDLVTEPAQHDSEDLVQSTDGVEAVKSSELQNGTSPNDPVCEVS